MRTTRAIVGLLLVAGASAAAGCASHVQMREPRSLLASGIIDDPDQASRLERRMTDHDIADLLDADIRAKLPTKVALARIDEGGWVCYSRPWGMPIDADELNQWEAIVRKVPHLEGVLPIPTVPQERRKTTLHDLREAAARMGCEMLLLCHVSDAAVDNYNDAAVLYWTFAGLWLVPGNTYEHRTVMQAIVVDCRTGIILGTATGDSHQKRPCPAAYGEIAEAKLSEACYAAARDDLMKAAEPLFREIVAKAARPRQ